MKPSSTSSRWSILPSRCCERRRSTSRRWSRKARSTSFSEQTFGVRPSISTFMLRRTASPDRELRNSMPISTFRIDVLRPRLQHDAARPRRFRRAHRPGSGTFLVWISSASFSISLRFLHLVGDLGDHDLPRAAAQLLDLPARAQPERRRARCDRPRAMLSRGSTMHAAGREIRARDDVDQRLVAGIGRLDQVQAGLDQLADVVRRDVGRHAHRDAAGAVGQQVREGRRQHHRLCQRAVVVRRGSRRRSRRARPSAPRPPRSGAPRCSGWRPGCRRRCCRSCPARRPAGSGR